MAAGVAPDGPAPPREAVGLPTDDRGSAPVHGGATAFLRRSPDGALRRSTA